MVRALLLQQGYGDRLSFRRFVGLALTSRRRTTTLWRFRQQLAERDLAGELFAAVERQLDGLGDRDRIPRGRAITRSTPPAPTQPPSAHLRKSLPLLGEGWGGS